MEMGVFAGLVEKKWGGVESGTGGSGCPPRFLSPFRAIGLLSPLRMVVTEDSTSRVCCQEGVCGLDS